MNSVTEMPVTGTEDPLIFTDNAANKVKQLIEEEGNTDLKLRVFVSGGGCSGFQYGFTFDEEADELPVSGRCGNRLSGRTGRFAVCHQEPGSYFDLRLRFIVLCLIYFPINSATHYKAYSMYQKQRYMELCKC